MALNSFAEVQAFIDKVLTDNNEINEVQFAPHGAFWNDLPYQEFVTGNIPNVVDPNTGAPIPILVKGNSSASNLIHSLRGTGLFDPAQGVFSRMPANGPPFFTDDQIAQIAGWIDRGCPQ
jgi:hypothetical protein